MANAKKELPGQPVKQRNLRGDTIINVITALVFFGLLGLGLWWVIKSLGEAGQQYTGTLIETRYTAETVKCQTNLRAIWQNVQMYAVTNGTFPPSIEALKEWSGNSRLFRCPVSDELEYVYIRGQNGEMFCCTNREPFTMDAAAYCDWADNLSCLVLKSFKSLWQGHWLVSGRTIPW